MSGPERDVARGAGLSLPAHGPSSSRGSAPGFPIPGELPPSPERPASGSLRPSAVSARTRSSGSPTLASPPVRRQPLCNPTTLNTHPRTTCETPAKRSGRYDVGHTRTAIPPVASPGTAPGAPQGKRHGPNLIREVDRLDRPPHARGRAACRARRVSRRRSASACAGTGSTATGRCASRRTRTARGIRSDWWADGAAPELAPAHVRGRSSIPTGRSRPAAGARPVARGAPPRLVRCPGLDVTWPVAPGCLSRPTGLRRRGAPHPGSHSGGTPSFARATDLGLPKTLGRLGKGSVIGFPNPRESSRPAVTTM